MVRRHIQYVPVLLALQQTCEGIENDKVVSSGMSGIVSAADSYHGSATSGTSATIVAAFTPEINPRWFFFEDRHKRQYTLDDMILL
jgi:hypothetical protein